jgi:ABC-type nitrate/sulfonate/bicarbonate transport system ATPase subunit
MTNTILQVSNVTKRYGSGTTEVTAVRDASLTVIPGEIVLIMGPSGRQIHLAVDAGSVAQAKQKAVSTQW